MYKFLHLPKTGLTSIKSTLIDDYKIHKGKFMQSTVIKNLFFSDHNVNIDSSWSSYILFIRDPIDRFVSHYHYYKYGQQYDTCKYFKGPIDHKGLVDYKSINHFIDDINSKNFQTFMYKHKSISWILDYCIKNNNFNMIYFIGTQENLENDFNALMAKMNFNIKLKNTYTNKRPDFIKPEKLNSNSIRILKTILKKDYEIILKLIDKKLLNADYLHSAAK
jgi:hypothetical protein